MFRAGEKFSWFRELSVLFTILDILQLVGDDFTSGWVMNGTCLLLSKAKTLCKINNLYTFTKA